MKTSINKFYDSPSYKQPHKLRVKIQGYSDPFDIDLVGRDQRPDCCIGHFGYNFYIRTPKGLKYEKYANLKMMAKAIRKILKKNSIVVESFGLQRGWRYRPVQNL